MATRCFSTEMTSEIRLVGTNYVVDLVFNNPTNQEILTGDYVQRIKDYAALAQSKTLINLRLRLQPGVDVYTMSFNFLNRESALYFAQTVGFVRSCRSIMFRPNYASFAAIL